MVAFHLPSTTTADNASLAVAGLHTLCADPDPDVRSYALYALVEEGLEPNPAALQAVAENLCNDPDTQIRELAASIRNSR